MIEGIKDKTGALNLSGVNDAVHVMHGQKLRHSRYLQMRKPVCCLLVRALVYGGAACGCLESFADLLSLGCIVNSSWLM